MIYCHNDNKHCLEVHFNIVNANDEIFGMYIMDNSYENCIKSPGEMICQELNSLWDEGCYMSRRGHEGLTNETKMILNF